MEAKPFKLNLADIPWESTGTEGRFGSDDQIVSGRLTSRRLGFDVTRLQPGMVSCPYHYHLVGEELFIIQEGTGLLRYAGAEYPIRAGDVIACPPGPEGAHQIVNDGSVPLVYYALGTNDDYEVCEYPDSDKLMVYGPRIGKAHMFRRSSTVPYMDGETS